MSEDEREHPEETPFEEPAGGETQSDPDPEEIDSEPGRPRDAAAEETPVLEDTPAEPLTPPELIEPEADLPGARPREELGEALAGEAAEEPAPEEGAQSAGDWVTVKMDRGAAAYSQPRTEETPPGNIEADTEPQPLPVQREWASAERVEEPASPAPVAGIGGAPPQGNAFGAVGDTLARMGITNRGTQQLVAVVLALAIVACCACGCLVVFSSFFAG